MANSKGNEVENGFFLVFIWIEVAFYTKNINKSLKL